MKYILWNAIATMIIMSLSACGDEAGAEATIAAPTELEIQSAAKAKRPATGYKVGDYATDFSLKNVDGKQVSLADYKDAKGFIVIFTCNHCPYAQAYESRIMDLDEKYAPKGYPVIAINPNDPSLQPEDSYEEMVKRAAAKNYTFPYLLDEKQEIYPQYGAAKTPHVYILQKENMDYAVKYIGAIDDNHEKEDQVRVKYAANALDALLAGKPIAQNKTVAIGCTIKDKRSEK